MNTRVIIKLTFDSRISLAFSRLLTLKALEILLGTISLPADSSESGDRLRGTLAGAIASVPTLSF